MLVECGDVTVGMLFVMYVRRFFSSVFAVTKRSEMDKYEVPIFMFYLVL